MAFPFCIYTVPSELLRPAINPSFALLLLDHEKKRQLLPPASLSARLLSHYLPYFFTLQTAHLLEPELSPALLCPAVIAPSLGES